MLFSHLRQPKSKVWIQPGCIKTTQNMKTTTRSAKSADREKKITRLLWKEASHTKSSNQIKILLMSIRQCMARESRWARSIRHTLSRSSRVTIFRCNSKQGSGGSMVIPIILDRHRHIANDNLKQYRIILSQEYPTRVKVRPIAWSKVHQNMATFRRLHNQLLVRVRTRCFHTGAISYLRNCHHNFSNNQSVSPCKCHREATMPTWGKWSTRT